MAETVRIEIPVNVKDNTAAGLQSANRNMSNFERSMQRTEQQLNRMGNTTHRVRLEADDNASDRVNRVSSSVDSLDGQNAEIDVDVSDSATQGLSQISDGVEALDGTAADVDVGANDSATDVINSAGDALENFDGSSGDADIGADDSATPVIRAAEDAVENFDGTSGDAEIGADDSATPVIRAAEDAAEQWGGSEYNATIGVVDKATGEMKSIFGALSNPVVQGATLLGVGIGAADTLSTYNNFTSMMSQVSAISGATGEDLELLTQTAKDMGATTKFTAAESAEAFNYMAMAGWKTQDMTAGISGILSLAAASGESLGTTSDIVTDALTAFGLKADSAGHFADVMAQASANANTNVSMLGESFKYVAPIAGAMNYSIEDTSLALGLMANASIKGSMAGTSLKTAIANMAAPTDKMAAEMEKYGISLTDNEGNMKSLGGVVENLRSSLGGLDEKTQTAAASTIFGKEAMTGMLAIINAAPEDYEKLQAAIYDADGAAERMSDTMIDNLGGSITLLQSAVDGVKITLGERVEPYLKTAIEGLTDMMPGASEAIDTFMNKFDKSVSNMTKSKEWQNADLFGKVNIAWDKIIAEPFTKWAGSKGKSLLSKGLGSLFSDAAKILPGGEEAGLTSWLSAAVIAKGTSAIISGANGAVSALAPLGSAIKGVASAAEGAEGIGGFVSNLGSMIPMGGKIALAGAAIAAAVAAIGAAIDNYNQKVLSSNLEEHFGSIQLSAEQAKSIASGILNAEYMVNVNLTLGSIENTEALRAKAEQAIADNRPLIWKSAVAGVQLSADETTAFTENVTSFIESKKSELEGHAYEMHLQTSLFLGASKEGVKLDGAITDWFNADQIEMDSLSSALQTEVENALKDGIVNASEAEAIEALQEKINNITARWKESQAQAHMDWIEQEYGGLSGKELTNESFTALVDELSSQRQENHESLQADYEDFAAKLHAAEAAGRLGKDGLLTADQYKNLANQAVRNQKAQDLNSSLEFETNTLNGTYGDKIKENVSTIKGSMQSEIENAQYQLLGQNTPGLWAMNLESGMEDMKAGNGKGWFGITTDADQANLNEIWKTMKPDADAMASLVDEYANTGQKIPEAIKQKFNETMEMGAAAGDSDAAWQVYANGLAESGDKALIDAINQIDKDGGLPEEFSKAWHRAMLETTDEPVELDGVKAELNGDADVIGQDEWAQSIQEKLGEHGTVKAETEADVSIKVKEGDTLWNIGDALGMDWHEIAEYNGLKDPYEITPDMDIKIPRPDVDTSEIPEAIQEAMSNLEAAGDSVEVEGTDIKVTLGEVSVDEGDALQKVADAVGMTLEELEAATGITEAEVEAGMTITIPQDQITVNASDASAAVQDAMNENGSTDITTSTDTTVTEGETDASAAAAAAKTAADSEVDEAFEATHETSGSVNATLSQTNNADEVYSGVSSDVQGKFNSTIVARGSVQVTLDWHITNPTASISTSVSGGTATATIASAHYANGGEVGLGGAELITAGEEGLEYIIPTVPGRRRRGIELWKKAGRALGIIGNDGEIAAYANGGTVGGSGDYLPADTEIFRQIPESGDQRVWNVMGESSDGNSHKDISEGDGTSVSEHNETSEGGQSIEVNVNMNPVIKIDGGNADENKIFEVLQSRIREMADDLGDEIAERVAKIFGNMPTTQEA